MYNLFSFLRRIADPRAPSVKEEGLVAVDDAHLGAVVLAVLPSILTKYGDNSAHFMNSALLMLTNVAVRHDLAPMRLESALGNDPFTLEVWQSFTPDGTPAAPSSDAFCTPHDRLAALPERERSGVRPTEISLVARNLRASLPRWWLLRKCAIAHWNLADIGALARPIAHPFERVSYLDALITSGAAVYIAAEMMAMKAGHSTARLGNVTVGNQPHGDWTIETHLGLERGHTADTDPHVSSDIITPGTGPSVTERLGHYDRLTEIGFSFDTSGETPVAEQIVLRGHRH